MNKSKSLNAKLVTLNAGLILFFFICVFGLFKFMIHKFENKYENDFAAQAEGLGYNIAAQFYERYGDVQAFAKNPDVQASDEKKITDILNTYSVMYGIYDLIMVLDTKGNLISVNNIAPDGKEIKTKELFHKTYASEPWFKDALEGKFTEDKEKAFAGTTYFDIFENPYSSLVYGTRKLGTVFSTQIKDSSGKVIGVVANHTNGDWFEKPIKETWSVLSDSGYDKAEITLAKKDGTLLWEYDPTSNEGKKESAYNWENLLKFNLLQKNIEGVKEASEGKRGGMISHHQQKQIHQVTGYSPITSGKWIDAIGWITMVRVEKNQAFSIINTVQNTFYLVGISILFACFFIALYFSKTITRKMQMFITKLLDTASTLASSSVQLNSASAKLSESSTEQAAAIQETASAIDEVSSMVKKNSENAEQSLTQSTESKNAAEQGKHAIEEMIDSISAISTSNISIMNQVESGNKEISEIVKVIAEIANKTKVINDIVFQTKLLSFNASVEAARAGEYGKGFAVVAEEIGNLAQMSGNASKEISTMLEASMTKVESIVHETRTKVEKLILEGKDKVENGKNIAEKCGNTLSQILEKVQTVDGMVTEIVTASKEQSQGVSEINKAITELDKTTHKNADISRETLESSNFLNTQAKELKDFVLSLSDFINGNQGEMHMSESNPSESVKNNTVDNDESELNVVPFKRKEKSTTESFNQEMSENNFSKISVNGRDDNTTLGASHKSNSKKVGSLEMPDANDPRFEDV